MDRQRVLIVDDDNDVRESLRDELSQQYDTSVASSGEEALHAIASGRFDAVVSDLRMPGMNGLQVLEYAHQVDPDLVRVLLTGHLDEQAQVVTRLWNAPFKVGKPWHDSLDITLRRAFEARETHRELTQRVDDALSVGGIDDELALADGIEGIAEVFMRRIRALGSVSYATLTHYGTVPPRELDRHETEVGDERGDHWSIDDTLSADRLVRVSLRGRGAMNRAIVEFLIGRARRFATAWLSVQLPDGVLGNPVAREQLLSLSRRATVGVLTGSLMHELASLLQSLRYSVMEIEPVLREATAGDGPTYEAFTDLVHVAGRMSDLFGAIRMFIGAGSPVLRRLELPNVVARAVKICGYEMHHLRLGAIPLVEIFMAEPLIVQVLVNLLRNAAEATPKGGRVDFQVAIDRGMAILRVVDDGPGVPPERVPNLFQPLYTTKRASGGSGLGLCFCAQVAREAGGTLTYQRAEGRGACFELSLPLAPES